MSASGIGVSPTWTMMGSLAASETARAVARATFALAPTRSLDRRTLIPRIRSRWASIVRRAAAASMCRASSSSPTSGEIIPVAPMLRKGRIRVRATSMT